MAPKKFKQYYASCFIILTAFVLVNGMFLWVRRFDNKYSQKPPSISGNTVMLDEAWMAEHPLTPLISGWEWKLGTAAGTSAYESTQIGWYRSFSKNDLSASPYGTAVYRLTLHTPERDGGYFLYLPEIFSACEIRVNGAAVAVLGDCSAGSYRPYVKNCVIPVPSGEAVLTVTAANASHYYSGMTYPPLFGTADEVLRLVEIQLILYGFLCFFTLGAAVLSLAFWFSGRRKSLSLLYGIMSLCFSVYISYPLSRFSGIRHIRFFYAAEDTAFYGMILCIVLISQLLSGNTGKKVHRGISSVCLFFCLLPAAGSFLLAPLLPQWTNISGLLFQLYKLLVGAYLLFLSARGLTSHDGGRWLLAGNFVFALGTLEDFLTAGNFEPIYGLWQTEYTSFFIVLIFTAMMVLKHRQTTAENVRLTHHLQEEVEKKTGYLTVLLNERRRLLSGIAHDMKAPIAVIRAYIDMIRMGNIHVDEETAGYLSVIDRKSSSLANQITALQTFNSESSGSEPPVTCSLADFLKELFTETSPYADAAGVYCRLSLPDRPAFVRMRRARLLGALENIFLNATEYTPPGGTITVLCQLKGEHAVLSIRDTGCGISPEDLPHIFDYGFSGSGDREENDIPRGIGLYFAKDAILEHGGTISAESRPGHGAEFTIVLPLAEAPVS